MKASTTQMLNTEARNSRSGRIGSTARRSTATKTTSDATRPDDHQMIVDDPQAYCVPPQDRARVSPAAPSDTNTMPR